MRVVKGVAVHPGTKKTIEVFLVRPPLYLTKEEKTLLDAKAVAAGFAPDPRLDRTRKEQVRKSVLAELCRRAVLQTLLGITRFHEPTRRAFNPQRPLAALGREKHVGGRFLCESCQKKRGRKLVRRSRVRAKSRKACKRGADLRWERIRNTELRKRVVVLEEKLRDESFRLRLALGQLDDLAKAGVSVYPVPGTKRKAA